MRMRIARIAKRLHNKFRGLYWRQMFVTVGMVLLTLFLLGASFFSLSYSYARGREDEDLAAQAQVLNQQIETQKQKLQQLQKDQTS